MGCGASVETKSSPIVAEPSVRQPSIVNKPPVKTPVESSKNQSNRPKMTSESKIFIFIAIEKNFFS